MNPIEKIHSSWSPLLGYLNQEPLLSLNREILPNCSYYPHTQNIFRVFEMPLQDIKVVILGQDPYHGLGQANGLAFSVNDNVPIPPSLDMINKELQQEFHCQDPQLAMHLVQDYKWRTLEHWKEQGVFLLNTALTVQAGQAGSHLRYWDNFIRKVIYYISFNQPCIWMLWGASAKGFIANMPIKTLFEVIGYDRKLIESIPGSPYYNYILKAAHPAAEFYKTNAGYLGCDHFYFANKILEKSGKQSINW